MNDFGLPDDCYEFLCQGRQLDFDSEQCEAGSVVLRSAKELRRERLPVETSPSSCHAEDPLLDAQGCYEQSGFYYVLAVSLTKGELASRDVLLWLPLEKTFATYDESHHDLLLFPSATWTHIVAHPLSYLNALWEVDFEERNSDFVRELKPWLDHPYRTGLTLPEVEANRNI